MIKTKTILLGILNITTHPHSPEVYVDALKTAQSAEMFVKLRGDTYGYLNSFVPVGSEKTGVHMGQLFKFMDISKYDAWFDSRTGDQLEKDELGNIKIPEYAKAKLKKIRFFFFPEKHYLVYEIKGEEGEISCRASEKYFKDLLNSPKVLEKFKTTFDVTSIPSYESLDKIFKDTIIKKLELKITKPNADEDDGSAEEAFFRKLDQMNVREKKETYSAEHGKGIEPSEDLKTTARVASRNGYVNASGQDFEGNKVNYSTINHPHIEAIKIRPKLSYFDQLLEKARQLAEKIKSLASSMKEPDLEE